MDLWYIVCYSKGHQRLTDWILYVDFLSDSITFWHTCGMFSFANKQTPQNTIQIGIDYITAMPTSVNSQWGIHLKYCIKCQSVICKHVHVHVWIIWNKNVGVNLYTWSHATCIWKFDLKLKGHEYIMYTTP